MLMLAEWCIRRRVERAVDSLGSREDGISQAHGSEGEHKMEITFSVARGPNKDTVTRGEEARKGMIVKKTSDIRARLTTESVQQAKWEFVGSPVHNARPRIRKCRQTPEQLSKSYPSSKMSAQTGVTVAQ